MNDGKTLNRKRSEVCKTRRDNQPRDSF
jgi:hypothetical protein